MSDKKYYIVSDESTAYSIGNKTYPGSTPTKLISPRQATTSAGCKIVDNPKITYSSLDPSGLSIKVLEIDLVNEQGSQQITRALTLGMIPNDSAYGEVSGSGQYVVGDVVNINASANTGYSFLEWREFENIGEEKNVTIKNETSQNVYYGMFYRNPERTFRFIGTNGYLYKEDEYRTLKENGVSPDILGVGIVNHMVTGTTGNEELVWLVVYKNYLPESYKYSMASGETLPANNQFNPNTIPFSNILKPYNGLSESVIYKNYYDSGGTSYYASGRASNLHDGNLDWHVPNLYEYTQIFYYVGDLNRYFDLISHEDASLMIRSGDYCCTSISTGTGDNHPFVIELNADHSFYAHRSNDNANVKHYLRPVAIKKTSTFGVVYYGNGADSGDVPQPETLYVGDLVTISDNTGNLVKDGYYFNGWNTSNLGTGKHYDVNYQFHGAVTIYLYAEWIGANTEFTVQFFYDTTNELEYLSDYNYGVIVNNGSKLEQPEPISIFGYEFDGWYTSNEFIDRWDFDSGTVTSNINLYAKWIKKAYTVEFDLNGHGDTPTPPTQTINFGGKVSKPNTPTDSNFIFVGWYTGRDKGREWDFDNDLVSENITLYAYWSDDISEIIPGYNTSDNCYFKFTATARLGFTGKFDTNRGSISLSGFGYRATDQPVYNTVTIPISSNSIAVKNISGLTSSVSVELSEFLVSGRSSNMTFTEIIPGDIWLSCYNKNVKSETAFLYNGRYTVTLETTLYELLYIVNWNNDIVGNGTENDPWIIKLIANVKGGGSNETINYLVNFNLGGHGRQIPSQILPYGSKIIKPVDPTDSDYNFTGWYINNYGGRLWNFETDTITGNTTLYAGWVLSQEFYNTHHLVYYNYPDANYNYNKSYEPFSGMYVADGSTFNLPNPPKSIYNYIFNGWLSNSDNQIYQSGSQFTMPSMDVVFDAQWIIPNSEIKCNVCDAVTGNKITTFRFYLNNTLVTPSSDFYYNCIFSVNFEVEEYTVNVTSTGYISYEETFPNGKIIDLNNGTIYLWPENYVTGDTFGIQMKQMFLFSDQRVTQYGGVGWGEYIKPRGIYTNEEIQNAQTRTGYYIDQNTPIKTCKEGYYFLTILGSSNYYLVDKRDGNGIITLSESGIDLDSIELYYLTTSIPNTLFDVTSHLYIFWVASNLQARHVWKIAPAHIIYGKSQRWCYDTYQGGAGRKYEYEVITGTLDTRLYYRYCVSLHDVHSLYSSFYNVPGAINYPEKNCYVTLYIFGKKYVFRLNKTMKQQLSVEIKEKYRIFTLKYMYGQWKCVIHSGDDVEVIEAPPSSDSIIWYQFDPDNT